MTLRPSIWLFFTVVLVFVTGCGSDGGNEVSGPTNLDPIIETQNDTSAVVGQVLALRAVAHDPDGDPLNFRLTVFLTSGEIKAGYYPDVDFDENTGDFLFRPTVEDRPSRSFRFRVHDTRGGADSTEFAVTVN